jgi:23S rRNA-/tRNA-specific pseudouridylate synthase
MPFPPVIFEDASLIAFDKPSGMLVAPDRWDKKRENLMGLVHDKMGHGVANVHRLDADTSGLLLCAKSKVALDFLSGQFQSKTVQKKYHAFVVVLPAERTRHLLAGDWSRWSRNATDAQRLRRADKRAATCESCPEHLWDF